MSGLPLVTAGSADHKSINRLLLHLRDWEFGSGDRFDLATSKDVIFLKGSSDQKNTQPTVPQNSPNFSTQWVNGSLQEVEAFLLELDKAIGEQLAGLQTKIFILVD